MHIRKDPVEGYIYRLAYNLATGEREVMKLYFWDIAGSATLAWIFFSDVDYIPLKTKYQGIVLAHKPRRINTTIYLEETPSLMKNNVE
jgi:hypothetical protein